MNTNKHRFSKYFPSLVFFLGLSVVWEVFVRLGIWPDYLFPAPSQVATYLFKSTLDGTLLTAAFITFRRLIIGYLVGVVLGVPLGLLIGRVSFFRNTLGWIALGLQALPSICWAPLALLWFGQTEKAVLFIVIMGCIWSIILSTDSGVRNVPQIFVWAARTMGSRGVHTWFMVILPAALPFILNGMKQGWAFAWRSIMAAEIYVTIITGLGLGHLLHFGRELHAMDAVVGIMLMIVLIGLATDKLLFAPAERFIRERWGAIKE